MKDEPPSGLDCPGFQCRAGYPQNGPATGAVLYCGTGQRSRYWDDRAPRPDSPRLSRPKASKGCGGPSLSIRLTSNKPARVLESIAFYAGRSGRARTCDPRFWRPMLYQLSYAPTGRLYSEHFSPRHALSLHFSRIGTQIPNDCGHLTRRVHSRGECLNGVGT